MRTAHAGQGISRLTEVEVKFHPAARHEIPNGTNRDEITADVIAFLDRRLAS